MLSGGARSRPRWAGVAHVVGPDSKYCEPVGQMLSVAKAVASGPDGFSLADTAREETVRSPGKPWLVPLFFAF